MLEPRLCTLNPCVRVTRSLQPRPQKHTVVAPRTHDTSRAALRRKHGQDARAAADIQHSLATQQVPVLHQCRTVRLSPDLRVHAQVWCGSAQHGRRVRGSAPALHAAALRLQCTQSPATRPCQGIAGPSHPSGGTLSESISLWMSKKE